MWRLGLILIAVGLGVPALAAPLENTPTEQYELARNAFEYQDYEKAVRLLKPLLIPSATLPTIDMVLKAREMLATSMWWRGDKAGFKEQTTELLVAKPEFDLDTFYYPPEMVREFKEFKEQLINAKIIKDGSGEPDPDDQPIEKIIEKTILVERTKLRTNPINNLLPFGIPQLSNGDAGKGGAFLAGQTAMLLTNIGSWTYMYFSDATGTARDAAVWTMDGSLAALGGIYLWSVLDAFANYRGDRLIEEKRVDNPPE